MGGAGMHIGEVAERTGLSLRSLRHWDEVGLLRPSARSEGGFRLYAESDVERILLVRRMKPLGFSLEEMRTALADLDALGGADAGAGDEARAGREAAHERVVALRAEAEVRRERLVRQLAMAEEFLDVLDARVSGR